MRYLLSTSIFIILLLTMVAATPNYGNSSEIQLPAKYQIIATLEEPNDIPQGSAFFQLNLTTEYEITFFVSVPEAVKILSLPEGTINHETRNQPTDVWIKDNLGNVFTPIVNDTFVSTPLIDNIDIPSPFVYAITLHFKSTDESRYHEEIEQFAWLYKGIPTTASVSIEYRLPKDYTILQNSPYAIELENDKYNVLLWEFASSQEIYAFTIFMPFDASITISSMNLFVEPSSLLPNGEIQVTLHQSFDLTGVAMIWNVTTTLEIPVYFPIVSSNNQTSIVKVTDGEGECKPLRERPVDTSDNSELGHYFVDSQNGVVLVYPRPSYQDKFQEFDVSVTFSIPNEPYGKPDNQKINFWEPYRGLMSTSLNYSVPRNWKINLTDSFRITFVLPQGTEFVDSDGEQCKLGNLDGKETVVFNYNSPINLPQNNWVVLFDNKSYEDFFIRQWYIIALEVVGLVVLSLILKFYKFTKKLGTAEILVEILAPASALVVIVIGCIGEFLVLRWSNWFMVSILAVEALLCVFFIFLMVRFYKRRKAIS